MNRIILVEDHERLAELIRKQLSLAGIAVDVFARMDTAWSAMQQISYQAMVLDRGLPDGDGISLLKRTRTAGMTIPCLILTARDALHDRVEGLDKGADDYLTKPFAMDEMLARVRALLRRPGNKVEFDPAYGDLTIKTSDALLCCNNKSISLAPAELQIMLSLVKKSGDVVRRTSLEAAGWGLTEAVTPNAMDVAIHRLRKKLATINSTLTLVNVRNLGYALRETKLDQ